MATPVATTAGPGVTPPSTRANTCGRSPRRRNPLLVLALSLVLAVAGAVAARNSPIDAIPDLSDPQVIVFADWMGRSPELVEDQVAYPLVTGLQSLPGVKVVRGFSMFGMSFTYVLLEDGTDPYWARSRVLERLQQLGPRLPPDVEVSLGPDASAVGWVYQYVLVDRTGTRSLADLRAIQDWTLRFALEGWPASPRSRPSAGSRSRSRSFSTRSASGRPASTPVRSRRPSRARTGRPAGG
ncbi:MAG: efflux RND transporter permease subunit [Myxococcota bacterium]